jgi:hypothetical protein
VAPKGEFLAGHRRAVACEMGCRQNQAARRSEQPANNVRVISRILRVFVRLMAVFSRYVPFRSARQPLRQMRITVDFLWSFLVRATGMDPATAPAKRAQSAPGGSIGCSRRSRPVSSRLRSPTRWRGSLGRCSLGRKIIGLRRLLLHERSAQNPP